MDRFTEGVLTGLIAAAAIGVIAWDRWRPAVAMRLRQALLGLLAVLALFAWTNYGRLHGGGHFIHEWELFHYQLGAKYFPETGYDGLYVASLAAQAETRPELGLPPTTRDVRNSWVVETTSLRPHAEEVKRRFTPERWESFRRDNDYYVWAIIAWAGRGYLTQIRNNHGFNGTPAWVFVARVVGARLPVSAASLRFVACLDGLMLLGALLAVHRTFGARTACLAAIIYGTGHAWALYWIGGAFLRMDWIAAIILATCAAKTRRPMLAGGLIGYATLVRLFPAAFLIGPLIVGVREWRARRSPRPSVRLLAGFLLALAIGFGAGCATGRGPAAWTEFAAKIRLHESAWLSNNVGLRLPLVYDREMLSGQFKDEPGDMWGDRLDRAEERRWALIVAASVAFLALVALAAWQLELHESIVLGIAIVFAGTPISCYYWVMLVLVPILRGAWMPACAIALGAAGHLLERAAGAPHETCFGMLSWGLAVALVVWLWPSAWRTLRLRPRTSS